MIRRWILQRNKLYILKEYSCDCSMPLRSRFSVSVQVGNSCPFGANCVLPPKYATPSTIQCFGSGRVTGALLERSVSNHNDNSVDPGRWLADQLRLTGKIVQRWDGRTPVSLLLAVFERGARDIPSVEI